MLALCSIIAMSGLAAPILAPGLVPQLYFGAILYLALDFGAINCFMLAPKLVLAPEINFFCQFLAPGML